jgi:mannose-6-phosphate isomerase-like protein (cupin superfamily)
VAGLDLQTTYLHLTDALDIDGVPIQEDFWSKIGEQTELHDGRLMMVCPEVETWTRWEMHPNGDEVVMMLTGSLELVFDGPDGEQSLTLKPHEAIVVPRGIWHRGILHEPGTALFITPGKGTEYRPV